MNRRPSQHLQIGELVALTESQAVLDKNPEKLQHIKACPLCEDLYTYLHIYSKQVLTSEARQGVEAFTLDTCPVSDMDQIAFFLTWLTQNLSEAEATQLYRHLNDCYRCSEIFITNWSGFLSIKRA